MKKLVWLVFGLALVACGGAVAETAVPPTAAPSEETAAVEAAPADTAVPSQPTATIRPTVVSPTPQPPTRRPTIVPATVTPLPAATFAPPDVPALVWLPYGTGNYGDPMLMVDGGELIQQPVPVPVEIFFDYQKGWMAYGDSFWEPTANQQSVTNLHLFNFETREDALWAEQVGRAAVTPLTMLDGPPSVAVAIHNGQSFDLVLMRGPDNRSVLVEDIDPYFSWSPDGSKIAYLRDNALFVTEAASDSGAPAIASDVYASSGWIGDAPLWLDASGYLLYADLPFTIVAADGSETIVPLAADGTTLPAERPFALLYAATANQLIAETEGMFGTNVAIYQLSDDFATADLIEQFDDAQLVGLFEEGASLIIVSSGEPLVLPLTPAN